MEILGTNKASDISVSGEGNPEYRVCSDMSCANEIQTWGTLTAKVLVNAHNYVQLRLISSSSNSQLSQAQLNVGGIVGTWQVTTLNAPIGPAL
ncbi:MAG: hypothetical protein KDD35_06470, partial [Bdellovibrionales bacterium]|nr:hypothetical protein [Bdellovibrionales bacterium]